MFRIDFPCADGNLAPGRYECESSHHQVKNKIVIQTCCDILYYSADKPTLSIYAAIENTGNNFYIEVKTDNTQDSFPHK